MSTNYKYYLQYEVIHFDYDEIKRSRTAEEGFIFFYSTFLPHYFPKENFYIIVFGSLPLKELKNIHASNYFLRIVRHGIHKRIIFFGHEGDGNQPSDTDWQGALALAAQVARKVRMETDQDENRTIYLLVGIGTYLRLYQLNPLEDEPETFQPAGGKCFELAADEEDVHAHLTALEQLISREEVIWRHSH